MTQKIINTSPKETVIKIFKYLILIENEVDILLDFLWLCNCLEIKQWVVNNNWMKWTKENKVKKISEDDSHSSTVFSLHFKFKKETFLIYLNMKTKNKHKYLDMIIILYCVYGTWYATFYVYLKKWLHSLIIGFIALRFVDQITIKWELFDDWWSCCVLLI